MPYEKLWADKYKPAELSGIIGQPKAVSEALRWLENFKPGKGIFLYGPPGVGKSLLVETFAKEKNLELLQMNASDSRSSERVEQFLAQSSRTRALFHKGKIILIDEVDGISGGERGAVASLIKIIKESKFPVFLIANDPYLPKLRSLRAYTKLVKFSKVHSASIEKRLREICRDEGIEPQENSLKNLARWSSGDLRSAISDLQTVAVGKKSISGEDLSILGYRERESNIFSILPIIFKSRSMSAGRNAIQSADRDVDEIFWWIENNIHQEFVPGKIPEAFDLLSKADLFRSFVGKKQNWRFKAYMSDLVGGISIIKGDTHLKRHGFTPYQPPKKIQMMGATKAKRAALNSLCLKIGKLTHTSSRTVRRDYLPYLKIILKKKKSAKEGFLVLDDEEVKLIKG